MGEPLEMGLAATKIQPPALPARLLRRLRLDRTLDAAVAGTVSLVLASAPAGSGKSTLLASWLDGRPGGTAWLQVEESDSDPVRFWSFLAQAIGRVRSGVAETVKPAVAASNGDELAVVPVLVNALAGSMEPLVVVVDDYHLIHNAAVHEGMERFIELCPPPVTVVISTRIDPPFRLGRLRVRDQLIELRSEHLRFDEDETAGLLEARGQALDDELLGRLWERTEGWAAGLVLAELSLRHASDARQFVEAFHGDDQLVVDYLTTEFLAGVTEDDRRRLLETSILEQLCGDLVDVVCGTTGGRQWLNATAADNQLMIGLDRTGGWFRYHHLLRDLLRLEAEEAMSDRLPELHERAARWFAAEDDDARAVGHWLAAGNRVRAARHMVTYGPTLISDGQIDTLRSVLERIGEAAEPMPWYSLAWGWCEYFAERYDEAEQWVIRTENDMPGHADDRTTAALRMNIDLGRGRIGPALDLARRLTAADRFASFTPELPTVAGTAYAWAGQAEIARHTLALGIQRSIDEGSKATNLLGRVYQAIVEFEAGDVDAARSAALGALETAEGFGMRSYHRLGPAYAIAARTGDDSEAARAGALHAVEMSRRTGGKLALVFVLTMSGDTLIDLGDPLGAGLLAEARSVVDRCPDPGIAVRYLERVESRHRAAADEGEERPRVAGMIDQLTEREMAVLRYLPTGLSQREIAAELYVSLNTVKTHCGAIYRKLGVGHRKAAVQAARDLEIL